MKKRERERDYSAGTQYLNSKQLAVHRESKFPQVTLRKRRRLLVSWPVGSSLLVWAAVGIAGVHCRSLVLVWAGDKLLCTGWWLME